MKQIEELENNATEIGREIEQKIRKLILRIESGGPLLGRCEVCPTHFSKHKDEIDPFLVVPL
ncbi:MAG: hypothetical protein JSW53_03710 [Candidatus Bathyarchaeota archaeon]|nr:MAG: hypothetical protein JSW53_03710 [Candidatus Bathyarchaeota archaeon]UCE44182.1 MAG: hypothetical protein JSV57_01455 [Candidatus Bathyarchaeota archaeon]